MGKIGAYCLLVMYWVHASLCKQEPLQLPLQKRPAVHFTAFAGIMGRAEWGCGIGYAPENEAVQNPRHDLQGKWPGMAIVEGQHSHCVHAHP